MESKTTISTNLNSSQVSNTTMVQVPADVLTTLMASVEQLKHAVEQVQRDNASMARELRMLRERENSGPSFSRFPLAGRGS